MGTSCIQWFSKYYVQCASASVASMVIIADGMQYGWTSPATPRLLRNDSSIAITKAEINWIAHCYLIGNVVAVLLTISIFNKMSRKLSLIVAGLPILFSWITIALAPSAIVLCLARLIGGFGRSMAFVIVPMYIGEIADPAIRGILGSFIYLCLNIGLLIVYATTPLLPLYVPPIIASSVIGIQILLLKFIPESPYYLLMNKNQTGARDSLKLLRKSDNVEEELKQLEAAVERQTESGVYTIREKLRRLFSTKSNLKALGLAVALRSLQMLSGVSIMPMHVHLIFQQAGGKFPPELSAIIYATIMIFSNLFALVTSDRFGRRSLMVVSCSFTALVLTLQGIYFYLGSELGLNLSSVSWMPLLNIMAFTIIYRIGLGTIPIVMISEVFSADVKVVGVGLADFANSISTLASNMMFDYTHEALGIYSLFWIYAGFCIVGVIFSILVIPETKGITLEEVQHLFIKKNNNPNKFKPESTTASSSTMKA